MNKKSKNTRELESKAMKGKVLSAFQLYQNYNDGLDNVEIDEIQATKYFTQCVKYTEVESNDENRYKQKNILKIEKLELIDFRCFHNLKLSFESDLTVIIGGNGKGKTSIAYAIAKTLSWINANILKDDGSGQRISHEKDINNDSKSLFSDVFTEFSFGKDLPRICARLSRSKFGTAKKRDSEVKELKDLASFWRIINAKQVINLPLFSFYSVERSHSLSKAKKDSSRLRNDRFDAYHDALSGSGKFEHFVEWFISLHKKTVNDQSGQIEELEQQREDLQQLVDTGTLSLKPLLDTVEKQLIDAKATKELANTQESLTDLEKKNIVIKAICVLIPSISKIWVDTTSGIDVIMLENDGVNIRLEQLSDGQRVFLSLVADLARRLVMLNPKLDNPLCGQGIIIIDEIELHLHPKWQQDILLDLQHTFPNLQFIITTHSPLVLSTVDKRCIRVFDGINNKASNLMNSPEFQTKGVINSDVLEQLMDTFATPRRVEESRWLDDFEISLTEFSYENNEKAKKMYNKIKIHFGENSYELKKCNSKIRLQKMKARVIEKENKRERNK